MHIYICIYMYCNIFSFVAWSKRNIWGQTLPAASDSRHSLLRHTASTSAVCQAAQLSAVTYSKHLCHATLQTRLLCYTADMSAVSHSKHDCCFTWTCLLCDTLDMTAVPHNKHVCCFIQQTCLLCQTAVLWSTAPSPFLLRLAHSLPRR